MNKIITPGAAILCAICLIVSGWALYSRFQDTNSRRDANARAWHLVICYLEGLTVANKRATPDQRDRAITAYDHILKLVDAPPCH